MYNSIFIFFPCLFTVHCSICFAVFLSVDVFMYSPKGLRDEVDKLCCAKTFLCSILVHVMFPCGTNIVE